MDLLKDIILQWFFALIPFISFIVYFKDKLRNYSVPFILITASVTLLLSMTFASKVVDGIFFDLRYVMIFFGLVYGGIQTGFLLLLEFTLYRLYLGGEGTSGALIIMTVNFLIALLFYKAYQKSSRPSILTLWAGIIFSILPMALTYFLFTEHVMKYIAFHVFVIPVQNSIGIWLLMMLFSKAVLDKDLHIQHMQHEKMETMNQVAATLAHEVRNPLTAVKGFLKLMLQNPCDPQKNHKYIEISLSEIERTESVLTEYLALTKPNTERRESVDLSDQLGVVKEIMSPYAAMHSVELIVEAPDSPILVFANKDDIKQVLVNFIKNAIEACTGVSDALVTLNLKTRENEAVIAIKDNGVGMSEQQIKRLGTIYFSTKSNGTGLGLTYSYQVIQNLGGRIDVSSKLPGGTKFMIVLPIEQEQAAK